MYMKPYEIRDVTELQAVVELADYYCALPVLSRSLDGTLVRSQAFANSIPTDCLKILPLAYKVRNEVLYRDTLQFAVGNYENPLYHDIKPPLHEIVKLRYNELAAKILKVERRISDELLLAEEQKSSKIFDMLKDARYFDVDIEKLNCMAAYLREVFEEGKDAGLSEQCIEMVGKLVENNTALCRQLFVGGYESAGGDLCHSFLCLNGASEPLPWDTSEIDW